MILPNIHKFKFNENTQDNLHNLKELSCNPNNVIFCPKLGNCFVCEFPPFNLRPRELCNWTPHQPMFPINSLKMIADKYIDCYIVPMNDVYYTFDNMNDMNYKVYIKHDETFYITNVTDKKDVLLVKSISPNYQKTLYRLSDHTIVERNTVERNTVERNTVEEQEKYRLDEQYQRWFTKEEFYTFYGSDSIWELMHPYLHMKRRAIWDTFYRSSYISIQHQHTFIKSMLDTYTN